MKFLIVYGSVRSQRQGIKAARLVERLVRERGHDAVLVDPVEYELPLLDRMYKEYAQGEAPEMMERLAGHIRTCDGVVIVSGEYNHSIPPALSNLLDHFLEEWFFHPALIVTYSAGGFGGVRSAAQLRSLLGEIGLLCVSSEVAVSRIGSFDESAPPEYLPAALSRALGELEWYAEAIRAKKNANGTPF